MTLPMRQDMMSESLAVPTGWRSRAKWELWWDENVIEFNRLAVTDPEKWEAIAAKVEEFQAKVPWTPS